MNQVMIEAIKVMGIGMGTVFFVLLLFCGLVKAMQAAFPYKEENDC
ncbi:MAG: OadG family protein [Firmicutes bacterium]|nr:OadG family protein [Bacillota bacterium]